MPARGLEINPFLGIKNIVDICRQFARLAIFIMKSGITNTVLTWVLAVIVLAGVLFALQTIFRSRELRMLQSQVIVCQSTMNRLNVVLNEAVQYGKTHPDIDHVLQPFETKPAAH